MSGASQQNATPRYPNHQKRKKHQDVPHILGELRDNHAPLMQQAKKPPMKNS